MVRPEEPGPRHESTGLRISPSGLLASTTDELAARLSGP